MGRAPCCTKFGLQKGPWTTKEDALLTKFVQVHGEGKWKSLPKKAGLLRCGKSCRLRWKNYLRPDIKRGNITPEEDDLIIRLHSLLGNRWSLIAGRLPGRTDNEIKNYWNAHLLKKIQSDQICGVRTNQQQQQLKKNNRKKKKKETTNNYDDNNNKNDMKKYAKNDNHQEQEKFKVYSPKPIRLKALNLPRRDSNNNNSLFTLESNSSIGNQEKEGTKQHVRNDIDVSEVGVIGENHLINFDILDIEFQSYFDTFGVGDHERLGILYDEYLQLLNMENCNYEFDSSFAHSFNDSNNDINI